MKPHRYLEEVKDLLHFWGKARPLANARQSWHPVVYHGLDVASVGDLLFRSHRTSVERIASLLGWPRSSFEQAVLFLLSLHDIGKLSRPFQAQVESLWPTALGEWHRVSAEPRHGACGLWLLDELVADELDAIFPGWSSTERSSFLAPFVGHHGRPVSLPEGSSVRVFGAACENSARLYIRTMCGLFAPEPLPRLERTTLSRVSWWLAGFTTLADWLGSAQTTFAYEAPELTAEAYLENVAHKRAQTAMRRAGLASCNVSSPTGLRGLTSHAFAPSPIQAWAEEVSLPDEPFVAFIEDVTGGGKTEAALVLAHRTLAAGRARGLYVAMPTMATANAMFDRLAATYRRLFQAGSTPSLALAHGAARLHDGFRRTVLPIDDPSEVVRDGDADDRDQSGPACAAWLADEQRKAFLAEVGVGTIDQALLAALPAKFQSLRLFGLAERVLIVDEAHAYDAYMSRELEGLLAFQAALGGSAIVLSATLPETVRHRLAAAYRSGLGNPGVTFTVEDYPRVTLVSATSVDEAAKLPRPEMRRQLAVERLPDPESAITRILDAERSGAAVAWVRNTVDDAAEGAERLRVCGIKPTLFHARMAMDDRLVLEREIMNRFGRNGDPARRPGTVVATQVIEQSLDLDFDLIVSDLAPIDLLIQRAGRLWRHPEREARPVSGPRLLVVSPDPQGAVEADWYKAMFPRAAWVYRSHARLWLTAKHLFGRETVSVPEDIRALVEAVYGEEAISGIPIAFERNLNESEGESGAQRSVAASNLLIPQKGYGGNHVGWDAEVRIPTRLGEKQTVLRLAWCDDDQIVPWSSDPDRRRAWALSEVSVRASRVSGSLETARALQRTVALRDGWTRYDEDKILLLLRPEVEGRWSGTVLDGKGAEIKVTYDRREGLRFQGNGG
ncbi:CRISPR-associated helicase Cas3' [Marinivivus vitaminiproducens]|uniref:CRISPR-associated helicase Cas3' n=1 Tax=Marinivivus vitaminiproducens TaxID=3035935 RepID=UPI0027AA0CB3|nr:CRISPR-associated helicase Cas3' [Geminicoccaceae bacterium SCSIO 64248]